MPPVTLGTCGLAVVAIGPDLRRASVVNFLRLPSSRRSGERSMRIVTPGAFPVSAGSGSLVIKRGLTYEYLHSRAKSLRCNQMYRSRRQRFATAAPPEMRIHAIILASVLGFATAPSRAERVNVFFDTDMETDCDDAAAMAVLHALADNGECEILGTVVSVRDWASAATVAAINQYYGRASLPLGMVKGDGVLEKSKFASLIATEFPTRVKSGADVPDATLVYRDVLEKQPDQSVTIVTVGYLTNLKIGRAH